MSQCLNAQICDPNINKEIPPMGEYKNRNCQNDRQAQEVKQAIKEQ